MQVCTLTLTRCAHTLQSVIEDRSGYINNAYGKSINYTSGIPTTGDFQLPSGTKATFNGVDSYIRIDNKSHYKFFLNYLLSLL